MSFSEEIAVLQAGRRAEIAQFHFRQARELERNIHVLRKNSDATHTTNSNTRSAAIFAQEKQAILNSALMLSIHSAQKISEIRIQHEHDVISARARQAAEIAELTSDLAKDLELIPRRSLAQANALAREATFQASRSQYEFAEELMKNADALKAGFIREQQQLLHDQYTVRQKKAVARHREFDLKVQSKMEYEIREVHRHFGAAMNVCRKRLETAAIRHGSRLTQEEISQILSSYRLEDDAIPQAVPPPAQVTVPVSARLFDPQEWALLPTTSSTPRPVRTAPAKSRRPCP
jgi:hypothetical protein